MNYQEAIDYIHGIYWRGRKLGLSRTKELLELLGNPQKELKFVHVAGTNGKGSVCAMLSSVFINAGYRTGLYISPYIKRFNERIQLNAEPIRDAELAEITTYISTFAESMKDKPTEFELVTAIGMEYFKRKKCDIVILETGLGGTLDSTNIIDPPEAAVITAIDYDHIRELGGTIEQIASAKAGRHSASVSISISIHAAIRFIPYSRLLPISDSESYPSARPDPSDRLRRRRSRRNVRPPRPRSESCRTAAHR